ncbi:MAG: YihY family inner membrane protein [Planctomycetes bacterium]|nr:YihY family inner membrane protein [Planctomycetota bacterium]
MLKEILTSPTEELGRWSRFVWFQVKLWPHCARLLKVNRSGQQAAALSYHTIFGIVPLAIIILMIFQLFPGYSESGVRARKALYDYFNLSNIEYPVDDDNDKTVKPDGNAVEGDEVKTIKLTEKIDEITEKFTSNLNKGAITFFSLVIVVWAAIGLLTTIERAFNGIWHVSRGRNLLQRIVNYWTLLTLVPLLLIIAFYFSTSYLVGKGFDNGAMNFMRPLVPYLITVLALFFLYFLLPNTKVSFRASIWGAAVAGLVWTGAKYLFAIYVIKFIPQQTIYGVMGIIPLSVLWIYITWMIVLFGLYLTYTTQHLKTLDADEIKKLKKEQDFFVITDFTVIRIMAYALEVFGGKEGVLSAEMISKRLEIPMDLCGAILDHLVGEGLLVSVTEPEVGVVLAGDANNITLGDISRAAQSTGFAEKNDDIPDKLKTLMDSRIAELSRHSLAEIVGAAG